LKLPNKILKIYYRGKNRVAIKNAEDAVEYNEVYRAVG